MSKFTLDATFHEKLAALPAEAELCDESGRTVGFFLSPEVHHKYLYAWVKSLFEGDEEELARARAEPGGVSTAEVLEHLEKKIAAGKQP